MLVAARAGAWSQSGAPLPYDAEVEWIESTGAEYIIIEACRYLGIDFDFTVPESAASTVNYYYLGRRDTSFSNIDSVSFQYRRSNGTKVSSAGYNTVIDYVITKDRKNVSVHGTMVTIGTKQLTLTGAWGANITNPNIAIFGYINVATNEVFCSPCIIHGLKIYDEAVGDLIRDLIPVRVGSVGYMYDKISGQLFGNAADSGAFIIGPDKTT